MKKLLILALSIAMSLGAMAQTFLTQVKPYGEKLWGYVNQNGEQVIKPQFKKCYAFTESGFATIYESKKFQFINIAGETLNTEISGFKLIEGLFGIGGLQGFNDGMIAVTKGKKWGYLNTDGKLAIELKYDNATVFNNGYAIVTMDGDFFVIDKSGNEVKVASNDITIIKQFHNGYAPFTTSGKKSGFINTKGEIAIPAEYASVGIFANGVAWAKTSGKKLGYINNKGEWVIEPQFLAAKRFDPVSGLARVKTVSGWTYVNIDGELVNIPDTESWGDFNDGLAKGKKGGKTGYYNNKGEWIITPKYEGGRNFKNGFAAVKAGGKWGFIDKSGKMVVEAKYAGVKDLEKAD